MQSRVSKQLYCRKCEYGNHDANILYCLFVHKHLEMFQVFVSVYLKLFQKLIYFYWLLDEVNLFSVLHQLLIAVRVLCEDCKYYILYDKPIKKEYFWTHFDVKISLFSILHKCILSWIMEDFHFQCENVLCFKHVCVAEFYNLDESNF